MPRASWKGFLRLSLVSCPIYLSPATTRTKSIRLYQVWQPKAARDGANENYGAEEGEEPDRPAARSIGEDSRDDTATEGMAPTRVSLLPHDPRTGAEIERGEGEYERGGFVSFTAEELKALDVASRGGSLMLFPPILADDEQAAQDLADRRFRDFGDKHVIARALVIGEARTPAPGIERIGLDRAAALDESGDPLGWRACRRLICRYCRSICRRQSAAGSAGCRSA